MLPSGKGSTPARWRDCRGLRGQGSLVNLWGESQGHRGWGWGGDVGRKEEWQQDTQLCFAGFLSTLARVSGEIMQPVLKLYVRPEGGGGAGAK